AWTYALDNDAVQNLPAGAKVTDTLTVSTVGATGKASVETITGTNDAADITGTATGTVTEDGNLTAGGTLQVSDVDTDEAAFVAVAAEALTGQYGTFTFNAETGAWTYALDNDAVQSLPAGVKVTDTLTVSAVDGTEKAIVVTITGTNDAADITGTATGTVTEDDNLTTGGTLEVSDIDDG